MVKCDSCGEKISIEILKCPRCGTINPIAVEHFEKMAEYDKKYKRALSKVRTTNNQYKHYVIRKLIVAALAVIMLFSFLVSIRPEESRELWEGRKAIRHKEACYQVRADYLKNGNYFAYVAYINNSDYLPSYKNDMKKMDEIVVGYVESVYMVMLQKDRMDDPLYFYDYSDSLSNDLKRFLNAKREIESMDEATFAKEIPMTKEEMLEATNRMQEQIGNVYRKYLGISEEEMEMLWTMEGVEVRVFLYDKINHD